VGSPTPNPNIMRRRRLLLSNIASAAALRPAARMRRQGPGRPPLRGLGSGRRRCPGRGACASAGAAAVTHLAGQDGADSVGGVPHAGPRLPVGRQARVRHHVGARLRPGGVSGAALQAAVWKRGGRAEVRTGTLPAACQAGPPAQATVTKVASFLATQASDMRSRLSVTPEYSGTRGLYPAGGPSRPRPWPVPDPARPRAPRAPGSGTGRCR